MKKTLIIKRIIYGIMLLATFVMIFQFSASSGNASHGISTDVTEFIAKVLKVSNENRDTFIETVEPYIRKVAHFSVYAFAGIWEMLFLNTFDIKDEKKLLLGALIGTIYAITDELHQSLVPGRSAQIMDVVIDAEGNLLGVLGILLIVMIIKRKKEKAKERAKRNIKQN